MTIRQTENRQQTVAKETADDRRKAINIVRVVIDPDDCVRLDDIQLKAGNYLIKNLDAYYLDNETYCKLISDEGYYYRFLDTSGQHFCLTKGNVASEKIIIKRQTENGKFKTIKFESKKNREKRKIKDKFK